MSYVRTKTVTLHRNSSRKIGVSFENVLPPTVNLSGTPVITTITPSGQLVVPTPEVNSSTFEDPDGVTIIPANKGVLIQPDVTRAVLDQEYVVEIECAFSNGEIDGVSVPIKVSR